MLRSARIVRDYGLQHEIPELTYEVIPLGSVDDRPWFNVDYLLMATAHLCQADFYFAMSLERATEFLMYWLVPAPELLPQPASESRRFFDVIREAMPHWASALQGTVGREVVRAYSDQKGYRVSAAGSDRLRVDTLSGEHLFVQFDDSGNIAGIELPDDTRNPAREGILAPPSVRRGGQKRRPVEDCAMATPLPARWPRRVFMHCPPRYPRLRSAWRRTDHPPYPPFTRGGECCLQVHFPPL